MMRLHVGTSLERPPHKGYTNHLRFAELTPRSPRPRPATLARWARDLPEGFSTSLVLPLDVCAGDKGWLALGDDEDATFAWIEAATLALKPSAVIVTTGRELTTGKRDRDRLTHYFGRLKTPGAARVWAPAGLWEGATLYRMAERLEVMASVDPLSAAPPPARALYAQVRGLGERSRLGEGLLLDLLDRMDATGAEEAWVSFSAKGAHRQARRLLELAEIEGLIPAKVDAEEILDET
ncbi:MAG: hypothetical protein GXP55_14730 [Deltaproteobacteria bacterium]|nr:hypothetical protein [Deltaproteobacteria bacterium]